MSIRKWVACELLMALKSNGYKIRIGMSGSMIMEVTLPEWS